MWFGALSTAAGTTFSGVILNLQDYNSHFAKMQQGAHGSWTYQLLFTAEPHEGVFLQTSDVAPIGDFVSGVAGDRYFPCQGGLIDKPTTKMV